MRRIGQNDTGVVGVAVGTVADVANLAGPPLTVVISAATNATGLIIRTLVVGGSGTNNRRAMLFVDGVPFADPELLQQRETWALPYELLLKPGQELGAVADNNQVDVRATWDPLP